MCFCARVCVSLWVCAGISLLLHLFRESIPVLVSNAVWVRVCVCLVCVCVSVYGCMSMSQHVMCVHTYLCVRAHKLVFVSNPVCSVVCLSVVCHCVCECACVCLHVFTSICAYACVCACVHLHLCVCI